MEKQEEKFKKFFSDESKIKEFLNDEEFAEKVSGGAATEQTYIDEFKKFGLNITGAEAEEISKTANKLLSVQKLDDETISNITGGKVDKSSLVGGMTGLTFAALSGGTLIAHMVSRYNAAQARLHGNEQLGRYYDEQQSNMLTSSLLFGIAAPIAGFGAAWGTEVVEDAFRY